MKIHAALGNLIIPGNQTIKHHGSIGVRGFRGGLIIVTTNSIGSTISPREAIGWIKISCLREHVIIVISSVIANQKLNHWAVLILTTPSEVNATDFRSSAHKITIMEMMIS